MNRGIRVLAGLAEPAPLRATPCSNPGPCLNPRHDHLDEDDQQLHCPFCGQETHYDMDIEDYRHDDLELACWQTPGEDLR